MIARLVIRIVALLAAGALGVTAATAAGLERFSGSGWTLSVAFPGAKRPAPLVIMLPGCSGNTPAAVRAGLESHRRALVAKGFAAGVLDVLGPRGRDSICTDLAALASLERAGAEDARTAAARLAADPRIDPRRIAFLGQSFGGSVALRLASKASGKSPFAAIVAYYPWCADGYGQTAHHSDFAVPVLIMTGGADNWTPVSRCSSLEPRDGTRKAAIKVYPGAYHSFDLATLAPYDIKGVSGTYRVAGNPSAAASSRAAFIGFLRRSLK